jgi:drug/metabolite transporter (DMT)-like permease
VIFIGDHSNRICTVPSLSPFLGIALKIISGFSFTLMATGARWLAVSHSGTPSYPLGQVVFFRSFVAMLVIFAWLWLQGKLRHVARTNNFFGHVRRGGTGSGGMFFGFAALVYLPLPDATAINYIMPLLTVVLAALVLKEQIGAYRWGAVGFGMIGVMVMLWPYISIGGAVHSQTYSLGAVFGIVAALFAAFAMIEIRKLTLSEETGTIVFYFSLLTTFLSGIAFVIGLVDPRFAWIMPSFKDLIVLASIGFFGGIGQITLTESYRNAEPSVIAPFDYLNLIWAMLIGWVLFSDRPDMSLVFGAMIVIAAGMIIIMRERHLGIKRKREKEIA